MNLRGLGKKDDIAQRVAVEHGPEAGDTVYRGINVEDSREQVELD